MSLEAAKDALMKQISEKVRPNSADLPKAQTDFCHQQKARKRMPQDYQPKLQGNSEEMQRRQAYSDRCLNALMKHAMRQADQELHWDAAVKSLNLGQNEDGTDKIVESKRWMSRLIKTDGSAASAAFNEKVVAMAALGQGVITLDEFRDYRWAAYERDKTIPQNKVYDLVLADCQKGVEGLLDILDEMVEEGRRKAPEIKNAAKQILGGNLNDQQLEAAYDVIESDAAYLMYNALNTMHDLGEDFVVKVPKEKLADRSERWEKDSGDLMPYQCMAEQVANPCYAILDPQDLYENGIYALVNPSGNSLPDDLFTLYGMDITTGIQSVLERKLDEQLEKYGLSHNENDVNLMGPDYGVYYSDERTVIVAIEPPCPENNYEGSVREDVPGRIMKNLPADIEAQCQKCAAVNTGRSSDEFDKMKTKLEALRGDELPESPNFDQVDDLMRKLAALETATQRYLDKKKKQRKDGKGKNPYEQARMDFAAELQKSTKDKLNRLRCVHGHLSAQQFVAENADGAHTAEAVRVKGTLEPQVEMFVDRSNLKEEPEPVLEPGEKPQPKPEQFVDEKEFKLSVDEYTATHQAHYKDLANQLKNGKWSSKKAAEMQQQAKLMMECDQMGKKYMAGAVAKELLEMEKKLSGENGPMQKLASSEKTGELIAMVWNSESFIDKVRSLDFSVPGEMDRRVAANTPKQVAKEIMQNYLKHQRNAEAQNNQQNAPVNGAPQVNNGNKNKNLLGF